MSQIIAILSGKGGTGKTSVCAGVATALAQKGQQVLCIDCDVGLRNLDLSLGLDQLPALSFADMFQDGYGFEYTTKHPVFPGLSFLTAPVGCSADKIDTDAFAKLLQQARKRYSYIFLDAAAGIEAGFTLAAKYADRVILVTGPDPASIRDANRAGQVLELMGKTNVRLIVNRLSKKMLDTTGLTVDDIMDQAGLGLLGIVPDDSHVVLAAAFRQPLLAYTNRGAAAACKRIAKRLQGCTVPVVLK